MMRQFKNEQLVNIINDLESALKICKSAQEVRDKFIELNGANDKEACYVNSILDPESYYNYRYLHTAITIVRSKYHFLEGRFTRCNDFYYHVYLYNIPFDVVEDIMENDDYVNSFRKVGFNYRIIGDFDNLSDCIKLWLSVVGSYISVCNSILKD